MKTSIASAFAAAILAAASFGSIAHAEGDYYEGAQKQTVGGGHAATDSAGTGSAARSSEVAPSSGSGDYYEGAVRPN